MQLKLIETQDGSHSLMNEALNEVYHNSRGALSESKHVFIQHGLHAVADADRPIDVLEVGMGTGLNVLLTAGEVAAGRVPGVAMVSLEPYPIPETLWRQLNYPDQVRGVGPAVFEAVHADEWGTERELTPGFRFNKQRVTLEAYAAGGRRFDVVYFDAFAPNKQADVWSLANFKKLHGLIRPGGLLVTYCAQGQFRRDLKAAGFKVESPPGFGKREMTRAKA